MPEVMDQPTQPANPPAPARPSFPNTGAGNPGPRARGPFQQAVDLQRVIYEAATRKDVKPAVLSSLARGWSELEERKRILKGHFKPGDVRATDLDPQRQAWINAKFRKANKGRIVDLPKFEQALAVEDAKPAKVVKVEAAAAMAKPANLDGDGWPAEGP